VCVCVFVCLCVCVFVCLCYIQYVVHYAHLTASIPGQPG